MHPFHKNNGKHAIWHRNNGSLKGSFHPFLRSQKKLKVDDEDIKFAIILPSNQTRIVKQEALEQVLLQINLLKNKN